MLAPQSRSPHVEYFEICGLLSFRCDPLRASLQPTACANRWRNPEVGSSCHGCTLGAVHAGEAIQPPKPIRPPCLRCGSSGDRLCAGVICRSCFNRVREVIRCQYLTFRVMHQDSRGWIIPAKPGMHIAEGVASQMEAKAGPYIQGLLDSMLT